MRKNAVIGCLGAAVFFTLAMMALVVIGSLLGGSGGVPAGEKIAQLDLEGIISSQLGGGFLGEGDSMSERFTQTLKEVVDDDDVKAIVIRINSPGGEITASDTIYHAVKKAAEKKPVVVYLDAIAASGGYYVACAAHEILANETTLTGSIGVIIQTLTYYELFEKVGLQALVFKSGELKDTLSGARKLTPDEEEYIQAMVDQMYGKFLGIVSAARGLAEEDLRNGIADGRVLSGTDALKERLIDATGYFEDAIDRARDLGGAPEAKVHRYRPRTGFMEVFGSAALSGLFGGGAGGGRVEIDISDRLLPRLNPGMVYLLPSYYVP